MARPSELSAAGLDPFSAGLPSTLLSPYERLRLLCDPGSVHMMRSRAMSRRMGERARAGDGVVAANGRVGGNPVVCYAQDSGVAGGSLGVAHAETIVSALRLAGAGGVPVVGFIESAGARVQEGAAALGGYAQIFTETVALSGRVPQISIITGTAAGGGAYAPALTDFVVMTGGASMFLTGPGVVQKACGETVSATALGGPRVHQRNGVCHFNVPSDVDAVFLVRELLSYLPEVAGRPPARRPPAAAPDTDPASFVPLDPRSVYDVREVVRTISDEGRLLEIAPKWARNVVTALCRIDGWSVGIVANQPRYLGGVLDSEAAQKATRFVQLCNSFRIPLVVLVDTPGFMPGVRQEGRGVIRHGAGLLHAFAASTVPRITLVLRKAYGGAYISMNSRGLGANLAFAWPGAELGIMAASQAVGIVHRRDLEAAGGDQAVSARLADGYAREHLCVTVAAGDGLLDEVIEPNETRDRIAGALELLCQRAQNTTAGHQREYP